MFQPFDLKRFVLHNDSRAVTIAPLTVRGPAEPWSYALSLPNYGTVYDAGDVGPVVVEVDVRVRSGRLSVGLLRANLLTFVAQTSVDASSEHQRVELRAPVLSEVRALILRNGDTVGSPEFELQSVRVMSAGPGERGVEDLDAPGPSIMAEIARRLTTPDAVVLDVGANVGDMTAEFLLVSPTCRVHAFEPHPNTFRKLLRRFEREPRVDVHARALGREPGRHVLNAYTNSAINSLSTVSQRGRMNVDGTVQAIGAVEVALDTVDAVMAALRLGRINLLKLDTQGHELEVLAGAIDALQQRRIDMIIAELLFVPVYERQSSYIEVLQFLSNKGFILHDFYDSVRGSDGRLKWCDALLCLEP